MYALLVFAEGYSSVGNEKSYEMLHGRQDLQRDSAKTKMFFFFFKENDISTVFVLTFERA